MKAIDFLEHIDNVRRSGSGWTGRCPAHDDTRNSLGIAEGEDGRILIKCYAGCDMKKILAALELEDKALFPDDQQSRTSNRADIVYQYTDEHGVALFEVVRRPGKQFAQRKPDKTWGIDGVRRVLYRLPEVLGAIKRGERVYIVEGEKDADNLCRHGLTATTCAGGASAKWLHEYSQTLAGADVVIIPDNDEPGRKHAEKIHNALDGVAASVRVVELPGLPPKGDVSDWLESGRTKEELLALFDTPQNTRNSYIDVSVLFSGWSDDVMTGNGPELWAVGAGFCGVEIGPGLVCLLGGAPGAGKTALSMQWVIDALRADNSIRAMICNVEMSPYTLLDRQLSRLSGVGATAIRNRWHAAYGDRVQPAIGLLRDISDRLAFHVGPPTLVDVARSVNAFKARLVVLDYVQRFSVGAGDVQIDKRSEIDSIMNHARKLADSGVCVLVISAVSRQKASSGSSYHGLGLASFRGSSELEYGADSAWVLKLDDHNNPQGSVRLQCEKNRHGETPSLLLNFDRVRQSFSVMSELEKNSITHTIETVDAFGDDGDSF